MSKSDSEDEITIVPRAGEEHAFRKGLSKLGAIFSGGREDSSGGRDSAERRALSPKSKPDQKSSAPPSKKKTPIISFRSSKKKHFRKSVGHLSGSRERTSEGSESPRSRIESELRELYVQKPALLNEPDHSPTILRNAVPPRLQDKKLKWQSSSTGTILLNTTINSPDSKEIVQCMAISLHWTLKKYDEKVHESKRYPVVANIWNEQFHPVDGNFDLITVPTVKQIHGFLLKIFTTSDLSAECGVMAMCYVDRLLTLSGMYLLPCNWRRVVLGAIILASKIWEEMAVWNVDYQKVFPLLVASDLALLEKEYLTVLQFTVTLKASVYAKYYYELRALSAKDPAHFPVQPLDEAGLKKLEERSRGLDKKNRGKVPEKPRLTRSTSFDSYELRPKRVIIN